MTKNRVFFWRALPLKVVYIGAQGAFRKNLGWVGQKWISEKVSKGEPLGRQGVESLRGGASAPPPLNPPLVVSISQYLGGIVGTGYVYLLSPRDWVDNCSLGMTKVHPSLNVYQAVGWEVTITALLVLTVLLLNESNPNREFEVNHLTPLSPQIQQFVTFCLFFKNRTELSHVT